jgi:hypothetical protein
LTHRDTIQRHESLQTLLQQVAMAQQELSVLQVYKVTIDPTSDHLAYYIHLLQLELLLDTANTQAVETTLQHITQSTAFFSMTALNTVQQSLTNPKVLYYATTLLQIDSPQHPNLGVLVE